MGKAFLAFSGVKWYNMTHIYDVSHMLRYVKNRRNVR